MTYKQEWNTGLNFKNRWREKQENDGKWHFRVGQEEIIHSLIKKQTFIYSSFLDFWNKMYVTSSQLTLIKVNKASCRFAFGMFRYTTHYYTLSPSAMVGRLYCTIQEMDIFVFNKKKKCLCSTTAFWFNFKDLFSLNFKKELSIQEFYVDSKKI